MIFEHVQVMVHIRAGSLYSHTTEVFSPRWFKQKHLSHTAERSVELASLDTETVGSPSKKANGSAPHRLRSDRRDHRCSAHSSNSSNLLSPSTAPVPGRISVKSVKSNWRTRRQPIFENKDSVKRRVRAALLKKTYDVQEYYHASGLWQRIARHPYFESVTLCVIAMNAIWLAVDADYNPAMVSLEAEPLYQIADNLFCFFFLLEWFVRFLSFRRKLDSLKDAWFILDSFLVGIMVLETWILIIFLSIFSRDLNLGGSFEQSSSLRLLRLLRLIRIARIARLLRILPELMILIKGMLAAMRSVGFTLALLVMVLYVFAIAFTQICADTDVGQSHFPRITRSMYNLLIYGVFLDSIGSFVDELNDAGYHIAFLFLIFVFLAAFTLMNMLIGVLCEVVASVAESEREHMSVSFVKEKLQSIVEEFSMHDGDDSDQIITKDGFVKLLDDIDAIRALNAVGVDPENLVDLADVIFDSQDCEDKTLSFGDFMEIVLQFRGTNSATVKDIVNLQKNFRKMNDEASSRFEEKLRLLSQDIHAIAKALNIPCKKEHPSCDMEVSKPWGHATRHRIKETCIESLDDLHSACRRQRQSNRSEGSSASYSQCPDSPLSPFIRPPEDAPAFQELVTMPCSYDVSQFGDPSPNLDDFGLENLSSMITHRSSIPKPSVSGLEMKLRISHVDSDGVIGKGCICCGSSNAGLRGLTESLDKCLEAKTKTSVVDSVSVIEQIWIHRSLRKAYADIHSGLDSMQRILSELSCHRGEHVSSTFAATSTDRGRKWATSPD